jgi:hypothetical protein
MKELATRYAINPTTQRTIRIAAMNSNMMNWTFPVNP